MDHCIRCRIRKGLLAEKAQKVKQELHLTATPKPNRSFQVGARPTAEAGFKQRRMHELAHWHAVLGESSFVRIKLNALSAAGAQIGHKPQTQVH